MFDSVMKTIAGTGVTSARDMCVKRTGCATCAATNQKQNRPITPITHQTTDLVSTRLASIAFLPVSADYRLSSSAS